MREYKFSEHEQLTLRAKYNSCLNVLKNASQDIKNVTDFIDSNADNFSKEDVDFMLDKINSCGE